MRWGSRHSTLQKLNSGKYSTTTANPSKTPSHQPPAPPKLHPIMSQSATPLKPQFTQPPALPKQVPPCPRKSHLTSAHLTAHTTNLNRKVTAASKTVIIFDSYQGGVHFSLVWGDVRLYFLFWYTELREVDCKARPQRKLIGLGSRNKTPIRIRSLSLAL